MVNFVGERFEGYAPELRLTALGGVERQHGPRHWLSRIRRWAVQNLAATCGAVASGPRPGVADCRGQCTGAARLV